MTVEVVGIGEAMIRLSVPPGERLETAEKFDVHLGGAEANVLAALAQLGRKTAWISRLPDNPLGRRAAAEMRRHGVDVEHVRWSNDDRMGLYFIEAGVSPRPTEVWYDRRDSAASSFEVDEVSWEIVETARLLHLSGITPALSPSCRDITLRAAELATQSTTMVSVDVNYRSRLWSANEAKEVLSEVCRYASVLICSAEDARDVFGISGDSEEVAARLAGAFGVHRVVVTAGAVGASWFDRGQSSTMAAFEASIVDRVGSGDAFAAGVVAGVLDDDLEAGVQLGLAMAAIKLGLGGDQLVTTAAEVHALIQGHSRSVRR